MNTKETHPPGSLKRMVRCPACDELFNVRQPGSLVLVGAKSWRGMNVIRCAKCMKRERTPNDKLADAAVSDARKHK